MPKDAMPNRRFGRILLDATGVTELPHLLKCAKINNKQIFCFLYHDRMKLRGMYE